MDRDRDAAMGTSKESFYQKTIDRTAESKLRYYYSTQEKTKKVRRRKER
jgi:hypothetical protein